MAKGKVKDLVAQWLESFLDSEELELYNVEFVKEAGSWFLRVYIDVKGNPEGKFVDIDQCQKVSKYLSEILDREDVISQNYYLEVSSPGIDRELIKENDFKRYSGKMVDVSLYQKIDGKKELTLELLGLEDEKILLLNEEGENLSIPREKVAKIKLAVII